MSDTPSTSSQPTQPRLQLLGITKQYPAVLANDKVDLTVAPGEIHAVLGENGAGKSTLMKIIYGTVRPDAGQVIVDGQAIEIRSPKQARSLGIAMVFQHFSLFDTLTVAENVQLGLDGKTPVNALREQIRETAQSYGLPLDPDRPVHSLSVGERQRVEIVRALLTKPRLLILDEPTSVLTPQAVQRLFATLRKLASEGCSILYISHKLDEIRELCSTCTVLRAGKLSGVVDPRRETNASLSRLMIGAEPPELRHEQGRPGKVALRVFELSVPAADTFSTPLTKISLQVHNGEILGIAGVSGNGQQELLAALSGEDLRSPSGSIELLGHDVSQQGPGPRRAAGMGFVPEERLGRGAVPNMSLAHNTLLTRQETVKAGWINLRGLQSQASELIRRFNVKAGGPGAAAKSLSGGNLQKFIVGREIDAAPQVLVISQPTWGVDVGAAAQIRGELLALRAAGCAVLVVSEELDELFEIADRLCVIARGAMSPSLPMDQANIEIIGQWMSGLWDGGPTQQAVHELPKSESEPTHV